MFPFVVLVAIICFVALLVKTNNESKSKAKPSAEGNEKPAIVPNTFDLHNLPTTLTDEERKFLYKVATFHGVRYISNDHIKAYNLHVMNTLFQNMPGWDEWDESIHRADGQYDRMVRAQTHNIDILSYDAKWKKAKVIGTKGDLYTTSCKECDCPDFQRRHLPCKHMYYLAMTLDGNVSQDI